MNDLVVEGMGRSILVLHGGMGDLSSWEKVTDRLRDRFRVARIHRRQYRLDVPRKVSMADETEEVLAAAAGLDRPVIVGHSSGAVLALEALVAEPGRFAGAVLYEPPLMIDDRPLGDGTQRSGTQRSGTQRSGSLPSDPGNQLAGSLRSDSGTQFAGSGDRTEGDGRSIDRPIDRARAAIAEGKPGTAFAIFLREIAGLGGPTVTVARFAMNRKPGIGPVVERQLDDDDAIDALGNRLAAYSKIDVPVLLLTGDRSPRHLRERLGALQAVLPDARRVTMHGQGHTAQQSAPARVAEIVARFVDS